MLCARSRPKQRRGAVVVLAAFLMIFMLSMIAFAVDMGYMMNADSELQRAADAAALAAAWELFDQSPGSSGDLTTEIASARTTAVQFASLNTVCSNSPVISSNSANSSTGDVVIGKISNPLASGWTMSFENLTAANAVTVRVRRDSTTNGEVPLFFARATGAQQGASMQAQATVAFMNDVAGFKAPSDGSNLDMLPFALDKTTWDDMMAGGGDDNWKWDTVNQRVTSGSDGIREVNLFPQGTGSPGNRGTVDIGSSNNSTADIARQIVYGISSSDLACLGGSLQFDSSGYLYLNGDTGISAGVKDELASIIGQTRIIPIFDQVTGPGNNAQYRIVKFVGVRILEVVLTGKMSSKRVMVQPANVVTRGTIPGTLHTSYAIYSPPFLIQ